MKFLLYSAVIVVAFMFFQWYIALAVTVAFIAFSIWSNRYNIKTNLAYQAYFVKGDEEKASALYQSIYNSGRMTPEAKVTYAAFCIYTNRYKRGRRLIDEVIASTRATASDAANARHYLAILEWKEGNLDEALSIMEEVHKDYPSTGTYGSLGAFYIEKAKRDDCFEDYRAFMLEAYEYNDIDKTIADNLGELYLNLKEYEEAEKIYSKLLEANQASPVPYYNYAIVLKELGKKDEAKENLEKALAKDFTRSLTVSKEDVEKELNSLN